jgi:uroporphyrinogen-III decarboxylase
MTSRERVFAAVKGQPVDRVPVMYWINPHMGCRMMESLVPAQDKCINFWGKFLWRRFERLGLDASVLWRGLPLLLSDYVNAEYALQLGADMALTAAGANAANFVQSFRFANGQLRFKGPWGSERAIGGIYMEVVDPVIHIVEDLADYAFPDFDDVSAIRKLRATFPDACVVAETYGVQDISFTQLWEMSQFMLAMMDYPAQVKAFFHRFGDWSIDISRKSVEAGADVVMIYDDYGSTGSTQISPKMWREFTLPQLKRIIEAIHEAGAIAMLHSCGYVMPLLGDFVEAELDILQSFQPKAGNELQQAVDQYGERLTFNTGIDIQRGETMTPEELRTDIIHQCRIGMQKGRFILGTIHNLQYTMPEANVQMLFETVGKIQRGEIVI